MVKRGRWWGEGELEEGGKKVKTFSYKLGTRDVKYYMMTIVKIAVWYKGKLLRE